MHRERVKNKKYFRFVQALWNLPNMDKDLMIQKYRFGKERYIKQMIFRNGKKDGGMNSAVWRKKIMSASIERKPRMKIVQ